MKREHIIERITDWRYIVSWAAALGMVALILTSVGSMQNSRSARKQASATSEAAQATKAQLGVTKEQIRTLRVQRDEANTRADAANARADRIIQDITCTQYQLQRTGVFLARLVYESDNASAAQKAAAKPLTKEPTVPEGCTP